MPTIDLNLLQERELERLIDYERSTCTVNGDLVYRCAFTSDGYSYFPAKHQEEVEKQRAHKRESRLIGLSALFAALCVIAGFLLGRFLA